MQDVTTDTDTTETEDEGHIAQQALLALMVLDMQHGKLETSLAASRKSWADTLGGITEKLNDKIRDSVPGRAGDCKQRLVEVQTLDKEREAAKGDKNVAIETAKAEIAENEAAFYEILRRRKNAAQMNFNFGHGDGANFDPHGGIMLDAKHLNQVRSAVDVYTEDGGVADGLGELTARLDEIGAVGLEFPDVGADEEDEDEDANDAGDGDGSNDFGDETDTGTLDDS